jgi:hypothetical protein
MDFIEITLGLKKYIKQKIWEKLMTYINNPGNEVPENTILFYPQDKDEFAEKKWEISDIVESLIGKTHRDYFPTHAYLCLPLTIANQYGFVVKSNIDMTLFWPGGDHPVHVITKNGQRINHSGNFQNIFNNFNSGIVSISNAIVVRTPPDVNILTIQPPNYFIPHLHVMSGVVETDNLRGFFTFNLKVTTPNVKITIKKGDWLSAFIPIPRFFVENFELKNALDVFDEETYNLEQASFERLDYERQHGDLKKNKEKGVDNKLLASAGRRYFNGIHPNESKYKNHQKRIFDKPE